MIKSNHIYAYIQHTTYICITTGGAVSVMFVWWLDL